MTDVRFANGIVYLPGAEASEDRILGCVERGERGFYPYCATCRGYVGPGDHRHRRQWRARNTLIAHHQAEHDLAEVAR